MVSGRTNLILRKLADEDECSFLKAVNEFKIRDSQSSSTFALKYTPEIPFHEYVRMVNAWPRGERLPDTFVPNTFLVGVVDGNIVGRLSFRHELNDFLERIGGHVGYYVIPSERKKGYASEMLRQILPIAKTKGLDRLLVTCDIDNIASMRVIEKNNGILENSTNSSECEVKKLRYWIAL